MNRQDESFLFFKRCVSRCHRGWDRLWAMNYQKHLQQDAPEKAISHEPLVAKPDSGKATLLTVPECDEPEVLTAFIDRLVAALADKPARITLRFVGVFSIPPDSALLIHDVLTNRPPGVEIITEAWSRIINSGVLVWLAGDIRRIRPTAFLHFKSLEKMLSPV